jgi:preprotein translocase subunit SecG
MLNLVALLSTSDKVYKPGLEGLHTTLLAIVLALIFLAAITAIVLILLQPSNSTGIDALGGSSETFFGKNKGKSIEVKMKKWTWICLGVILLLAILFYIIVELPIFFS